MKKQIFKIAILAIITLLLAWVSTIFWIFCVVSIFNFAYSYFVRVKMNKIPALLDGVTVTEDITFFHDFVPYVAIKILKFKAITWFRTIYVKSKAEFYKTDLKHETQHLKQIYEIGAFGFYYIYVADWIYRLITTPKDAYELICFEINATLAETIDEPSDVHYSWRSKFLM